VEITVDNLKSYFKAHNQVLRYGADSRVFSLTPFHFDVSIEDTLLPLSVGAFVYQYAGIVAGPLMRRALSRHKITHLIAVSTLLTMISTPSEAITAEQFPQLQMLMTGAEVCDPKIINLWKQTLPEVRLINAYGPTETTIVCTCYLVERADPQRQGSFPIGLALDGVATLIVDPALSAVAVGEVGELCIGGAQVMRGYFQQPEETAKVIFVRDGIRYYRTGDLCVMQPDGNILYLGRNDDEVKIAGKRVHLGEIRQRLMALPGIDRVAIGTMEQTESAHGSLRRCIAVVLISTDRGHVAEAQRAMTEALPAYMRPRVWGHAHSVDLSASGKTDEKALLKRLQHHASASSETVFWLDDAPPPQAPSLSSAATQAQGEPV
jgi:acyl-coenzyme A synthetase/AMP-(fatty) acid ligase